jgi:hypothetical protein
MGAEYDLIGRHPQAEVTLKNIGQYQVLMEDLRGGFRAVLLNIRPRCSLLVLLSFFFLFFST